MITSELVNLVEVVSADGCGSLENVDKCAVIEEYEVNDIRSCVCRSDQVNSFAFMRPLVLLFMKNTSVTARADHLFGERSRGTSSNRLSMRSR